MYYALCVYYTVHCTMYIVFCMLHVTYSIFYMYVYLNGVPRELDVLTQGLFKTLQDTLHITATTIQTTQTTNTQHTRYSIRCTIKNQESRVKRDEDESKGDEDDYE